MHALLLLQVAQGTVPLTYEMGSPVVTLDVRKADGTARPTRFLVDTGGGALILTEAVAKDAGLGIERDKTGSEEGMKFAPMQTPTVEIGGFPLDLAEARCAAVLETAGVMHGATPEGLLPGHVLARHHVVFDFPAGKFTIAKPGALEPKGEAVPSPIAEKSGFPRIELLVGGEKRGFLLDTGASFTMVSIREMQRWRKADSTLPSMIGAVGDANMTGGPMEAKALLARLPALQWGPHAIEGVAAVSRQDGVFEEWMSGMMTEGIVGAIGGNVLRRFRVEIDYAAGKTYLQPAAATPPPALVAVGLVLGETSDGGHRVDALAHVEGKPVCEGIEVGDLVRTIDGKPLAGLRHRQVVELLRGEPGTAHALTLEREGKPLERRVQVTRLLEPAPR